jgi:hypothetical protein
MTARRSGRPKLGDLVYQLKVTLLGARPPIWRRLLVTDNTNLHALHLIIQDAMGWQQSHLYHFELDEIRYTEYLDDEFGDDNERPAKPIRLGNLGLKEGDRLAYLYDFGDHWLHEVLIEVISPVDPASEYPQCLAGRRACPPEDCGGIPGYEDLLVALRSPSHPERREWLTWVGPHFNAEEFDIAAADLLVRKAYPARRRRQTDA